MVFDGETGFLVNPDDLEELAGKIKSVLNSPELAAKFKENGRKRVEQHFSWESITERTVALYRQLIGAPVFAGKA